MHFEGWEEADSPQRSLQAAHLVLPSLILSAIRKQKQLGVGWIYRDTWLHPRYFKD